MAPLRLVSVALAAAACVAPSSAPAPEVEPAGRALFDGRTLDGWEGDARFWRVEDGAIVGESTAERPCERTTYLVWRGGECADFELTLAWRMHGGNSGVQFRSRADAPEGVAGYQADLEAGPDWTGGLYEQDGRGIVTRRGERVVLDERGGKTVERFADGAELLARVAADGWNELRVTAFGPRLTVEVNGELFSETIDLDPARSARRGALALQLHQGAPMRVEFRDVRLRELASAPDALSASPAPHWIWPAVPVTDEQTAWFRRRFELAGEPERAELWFSADNHGDVWLAGQGVVASDDWEHPVRVDVAPWLRAGENELLVRAENEGSAAGLVLRLEVELADGTRVSLASDERFEACVQPAGELEGDALAAWLDSAPWRPAVSLGALGVGPWGTLGEPIDDLGEATPAEDVHVPPGFTVERLYSVPLASQGSWVSLAVDPRGVLYASDQYGGLYRIHVPAPGAPDAARVERLPLALGEAHGLLWAFDSLYAVVSAAGEHASGLYRASDTDGDGELDHVDLLSAFDGDGEHGPHAVVLDADGQSLLVVAGNFTKLPAPLTHLRRPQNWAEDTLLPVIVDPGGHAVDIHAPGGWVARTDRDGRAWELVAAGMRNAYDLALSPDGELFTYDSDMEWDIGLPWYKPTRVLHLVSGGEFGWRTGSGNWPADALDALPGAAELGIGSPTGIVFGTDTRFPAPWNRALFACDWAYGRVFAVHLEPSGASYRGTHEVFASGQPFPVTDVVVGPDGALYLTTGGRRTQSGLYRIAWTGPVPAPAPIPVDPAAIEARAARHRLETLHAEYAPASDAEALDYAWAFLAHEDGFLRAAARVVVEHRPVDAWRERALAESEPRAALEALLALLHCDASAPASAVLQRAAQVFAEKSVPELRLDALRLCEVALARLDVGEEERAALRAALDPAYPSGDARLDRGLLPLLVHLDADVAERALAALDRAPTQEERIAILNALRVLGPGWTVPGRVERVRTAFAHELAAAAGGASVHGYVRAMCDELCQRLGIEPPADESQEDTVALGFVAMAAGARAWTLAELEPALTRVADRRSFERGKAAYEAASCLRCHRMAGEGEDAGPDLTGAAGRYSARDLLLAILEPSREVPDVWRDTEFWGDERLLAVGRLERESGDELVVLDTAGARLSMEPAAVTERRPHALSRMPEGLLGALGEDDVLDLLAYVLAGGSSADSRFAGR